MNITLCCCYVYTLYNLFTHSSHTSLLILLLFIKSTIYCPHFILLHILFVIIFYILFLVFYLYLCILSCVVLHIIALSIERTWLTFTFMHLADAFIQSDLQCIQAIHLYCLCVFSGNRTHNHCAANAMLYHWATGTLTFHCWLYSV